MWGALVDYNHFTQDASYNAITSQALESQMGPKYDYMVPMREKEEANDDQAFWGFATMSAAEKGYPEPTTGGYTWLQLTENLWNTQVRRWDTTQCGGGLKWQIFDFNAGYDYKNSVSNGAFFNLAARLARYTGNQTYLDWAEKSWDWSASIGLISPTYDVFDGSDALLNCRELNHIEWTYNLGIHLYGAAMLYNLTDGSAKWKERTQGLLDASKFFFSPYENSTNVMYEWACEPVHTCNYDQFSFKGYLSRFMWATTLVAPFTKAPITNLLQTSAKAAAQSCTGGRDGVTCGTKWYVGGWDNTYGVGQQMTALETIQGLLIADSKPPIQAARVRPAPVSTAVVVETPRPAPPERPTLPVSKISTTTQIPDPPASQSQPPSPPTLQTTTSSPSPSPSSSPSPSTSPSPSPSLSQSLIQVTTLSTTKSYSQLSTQSSDQAIRQSSIPSPRQSANPLTIEPQSQSSTQPTSPPQSPSPTPSMGTKHEMRWLYSSIVFLVMLAFSV